MGFVPGTTTQIEAFLTQLGAQELMTKGVTGIKYFAIADDAANYSTTQKLTYGEVFTLAGKYSVDGKYLSVLNLTDLPSRIFVDNTTETLKTFETMDNVVMIEEAEGATNTTTLFNVYPYEVDRTDNTTSKLNWIKDLMLPYGTTDNSLWSATYSNNGYSDTAIAGMNTDDFLFFVVDGLQQAYIDGKSIKLTIPYLSGTTDVYGSYLNTNRAKNYYDPLLSETSGFLNRFGTNVVLLFSDSVQKPNNDASKSWATGYDYTSAPYSQGGKSLANYTSTGAYNVDTAVGIAYLDKGVVVIFNSYLYNGYVNRTNNTFSLNNRNVIRRSVANFVCDLPIGKFYRSQNSTFGVNTPVRISTIGLYNESKQLVAVGRLNSEIEKSSGQRFTFLVKLVI